MNKLTEIEEEVERCPRCQEEAERNGDSSYVCEVHFEVLEKALNEMDEE